MRNSLRFAVVLFFLGLLTLPVLMGNDTAEHTAVGGPDFDMRLLGGLPVDPDHGEQAGMDRGEEHDTGATSDELDLASNIDGIDDIVSTLAATDSASSSDAPEDDAEAAAVAATAEEEAPRPMVINHIVQRGETLWDIALHYGIDVDTIVAANDLPDINRLRVGQELKVLTVRGALHTVQRGESLWDISRAYNVAMDEIISTNGISDPSRLQVRQQLIIPGGQAQAAALRREALVSSSGQLLRNFDWPTHGRISSRYGPRWGRTHHGIDLAVPVGTPIRAAAAGTVTYSGAMGTYGIIVIIDHGNGVETRYAHLSRTAVSRGQRVQRGALIAYSGNTGNSTGPHLHFEIRHRGQSVDPEQYLKR